VRKEGLGACRHTMLRQLVCHTWWHLFQLHGSVASCVSALQKECSPAEYTAALRTILRILKYLFNNILLICFINMLFPIATSSHTMLINTICWKNGNNKCNVYNSYPLLWLAFECTFLEKTSTKTNLFYVQQHQFHIKTLMPR